MTYCKRAFDHIFSDANGHYKLCCVASINPDLRKYTTNNTKPFEFFMSDEMEAIRNDMIEGKEIKGCEGCYANEKAGFESHRAMWQDDKVTEVLPHSLEVKLRIFGSACNLSCYMCHPGNSTTRNKELRQIDSDIFTTHSADYFKMDNEVIEANVEDVLDHIDLVGSILIIGGEPFLMTKHWEFLDKIPKERRKNIKLLYQTNLTKTKHRRWNVRDYLAEFKDSELQVSCDHFGERLKWIRYPIDVPEFEANLVEFKQHISWLNLTVSILNVHDLCSIVEYYDRNFGLRVEPSAVVTLPKALSIKNLPDDMKETAYAEIERLKRNTWVHEFVEAELNKPRDEQQYEKFRDYIKKLDAKRGTNANEVFGWDIYDGQESPTGKPE